MLGSILLGSCFMTGLVMVLSKYSYSLDDLYITKLSLMINSIPGSTNCRTFPLLSLFNTTKPKLGASVLHISIHTETQHSHYHLHYLLYTNSDPSVVVLSYNVYSTVLTRYKIQLTHVLEGGSNLYTST